MSSGLNHRQVCLISFPAPWDPQTIRRVCVSRCGVSYVVRNNKKRENHKKNGLLTFSTINTSLHENKLWEWQTGFVPIYLHEIISVYYHKTTEKCSIDNQKLSPELGIWPRAASQGKEQEHKNLHEVLNPNTGAFPGVNYWLWRASTAAEQTQCNEILPSETHPNTNQ